MQLAHGVANQATLNTPQALSANSSPLIGHVTLSAPSGNSGVVYIGGATDVSGNALASTNGIPMAAGSTLQVFADSLSQIWMVGAANDKLRYLGQVR